MAWKEDLGNALLGFSKGYNTASADRMKQERQLQGDVRKAMLLAQLKQQMMSPEDADLKKAQADYYRFRSNPQAQAPIMQPIFKETPSGIEQVGEVPKGAKVMPFKEPQAAKGLPAESAGKLVMLGQGEQDLTEAENILFPGGTFSPKMAFASNFPGGGIPGSPGRAAFSKILNAVNAKLRAETGAAATPQEAQNILQRFLPTTRDSDATAKDKYRRLKEFMTETRKVIDPSGKYSYGGGIGNKAGAGANVGGMSPTEEDIQHTLKLHPEFSRDQLLRKLGM
jgi:hypothetical protein